MEQENTAISKNLSKAIVSVQTRLTNPTKDTDAYKYKYATLDQIRNLVVPVLQEAGLAVVQFPVSDNSKVGVETVLLHESGESVSKTFAIDLPKKDPQSIGSALTYFRRYALLALLNLAPEDDDGKSAQPSSFDMESNPGEYVIKIGKNYKGMRLDQVDPGELYSFAEWLKGNNANGVGRETQVAIERYLADINHP